MPNEQYTYLLVNLLAISIPLIHSLSRKSHFYGKWKALAPSIILTGIFFLIWDVIFTSIGIWSFNPDYFIGITLFNLPLEEYLFFICIPFACVFTYEFIKVNTKKYHASIEIFGWLMNRLMLLLLLTVIVLAYDRLYTLVTAVFFAVFILYMANSPYRKYSGMVYLSYIPLLIPFFLVNGTLTGYFITDPIVSYNNLENLGIRWATIPIEDAFYGLFLIKSNILFFEYFNASFAVNKPARNINFFSITKPVKP